jgi:hypothetical protein
MIHLGNFDSKRMNNYMMKSSKENYSDILENVHAKKNFKL